MPCEHHLFSSATQKKRFGAKDPQGRGGSVLGCLAHWSHRPNDIGDAGTSTYCSLSLATSAAHCILPRVLRASASTLNDLEHL